jgi:hypothetical protein
MNDDETCRFILTNRDLPLDTSVRIFSLAGIIVTLICKSNDIIPINGILSNDLYWRALLMKELYIGLSEAEIISIIDETNRLRLIHPDDKSLKHMSYMEMYRYMRRGNVTYSYYDSYFILRLSVQDAINRLKGDYLRIVLKSITDSALSCGNLLGYKYIAEKYKL